jgi:hypothetical protein
VPGGRSRPTTVPPNNGCSPASAPKAVDADPLTVYC